MTGLRHDQTPKPELEGEGNVVRDSPAMRPNPLLRHSVGTPTREFAFGSIRKSWLQHVAVPREGQNKRLPHRSA